MAGGQGALRRVVDREKSAGVGGSSAIGLADDPMISYGYFEFCQFRGSVKTAARSPQKQHHVLW